MDTVATGKPIFVARQPIFDAARDVQAYELLFRSSLENRCRSTCGDSSTLDVISSTFVEIGIDELTGGRRAFINFTRNLLLEDVPSLLSPELMTVEILEDIEPDEPVLRACRKLKDAGYTLALDDFVLRHTNSPLLELADIVKVDFLQTTPDQREKIVADLVRRKITPLAEKVETEEEFNQAAACGFTHFQGYFFSRPAIHKGRTLSASKLAHLQMMEQLSRPEISIDELERVIKQDVPLSYKLLRFIASAWFGLKHEITSIRHALAWLGNREVRKWYYLVCLRDIGSDKPSELLVRSIARAKMAEGIAMHMGQVKQAPGLFLLGMFSLIDVLLDMPMDEVVQRLPLDEPLKNALLGQPSPLRQVLDTVISYERGDWDSFATHATALKLDDDLVPDIFRKSLKWADQACQTVS